MAEEINLDHLFHQAMNAPMNNSWETLRGKESKKEQAQRLLVKHSTKAEHMMFLMLTGISREVRLAAANIWFKKPGKSEELEKLAICVKDSEIRSAAINTLASMKYLNPHELKNIAMRGKSITEKEMAVTFISSIASLAVKEITDEKTQKKAKEAQPAACVMLEVILYTSTDSTIALIAFKTLEALKKIKPKDAEKYKKGATSGAVKAAAGKLLKTGFCAHLLEA